MKKRITKIKRENPNKKIFLIITSIIIILLVALLVTKNAIRFSPEDPTADEILSQQVGIDPTQTLGNIEDIRNKYLAQEWSKVIADKPFIGPIHKFFLAHPLPFKILFNLPYSFTITFLIVFVLWIYFIFIARDVMSFTPYPSYSNIIVSILTPILIAHLGLFNITAEFLSGLLLSESQWWLRWIIGILVIAALGVFFKIEGMIAKKISKAAYAERINKIERTAKEAQEFKEGFQQGAGI